MSAHSYSEAFLLPARSNSLGPASNVRCDHCREDLGLGMHRYWHMQFCSSACMTAYQQRLAPETKVKICRLDVLRLETLAELIQAKAPPQGPFFIFILIII